MEATHTGGRHARAGRTARSSDRRVSVVIAAIAMLAALPIGVALLSLAGETGDIWRHLAEFVLPGALANTAWLVIGVVVVAGSIGVVLAWTVAIYEFPGRRFFNWALILPMAMPGYVLAFAFAAIFEYTGPLQTLWRDGLGNPFAFPDIGARGASIATLGLALYPYVFLVVRDAFATQGVRGLEVAQSCGLRPMQGFFRVSLPLARPFIVAGTGLVVMECLADFGTVKLYNYTTFTTAIYQAWFGLFSLQSALQLSLVLISIVMVALLLERRLRGKARYTADGSASFRQRIRLSGRGALLASTLCSAIFIVAFAAPALLIASWSVRSFAGEFDVRYWTFAGNSLKLAAMAAGLIVLLGLLLAYAARAHHGAINQVLTRLATAGYAIPGAVLAVGFFVPVAMLSRSLTNLSGGIAVSLQSGLLVILLAYAARYLAVAHGPIDSALLRINPNVEDASRGLGITGTALLRRLHLPVVRPALWTAALLVFVDVMKELPITLMTRPYGWDTLAVRVFQLTTEGEWERAALPSLAIVLAGVVPVILLTRQRDHA